MTQAREEQLISDVSATKALLEQFMKEIKPTLATREEVKTVESTVCDHIENHRDARGLTAVWVGMAVTAAFSMISFFGKWPK